jgi:hypothetical protein
MTMRFKIYDASGKMVGTARAGEDAAMFVGVGNYATVKVSGRIVWREGKENFLAADSYDNAAEIMNGRIYDNHVSTFARARKITIAEARFILSNGADKRGAAK